MATAFIKHTDKPKIGLDGTGQVIQASASDPVLEIIKDLPNVKISDEIADRSMISIPSPWAVFLSFDSIFFGDTVSNDVNGFGKIAEKAKKDWRAMLTMIAFRPLLGVNIKTETYYISENINGE
ncbi:MAG: hypothetical protein IJ583_16255, partial [Firmicutes bacterium]|nr:hypothetical protein [Bacillota bacterium]